MVEVENQAALDELLQEWQDSPQQTRKAFLRLKDYLTRKEAASFYFDARPGVTYSLRARHANQQKRQLYVMVDVIDDDPANRWLSVCFYGEMISDPDQMGDFVPEGLLGEDAHCFDVEAWDENLLQYVEKRLDEAHASAATESL